MTKRKRLVWIGIFFAILFLLLFILSQTKTNRYIIEKNEEYPLLDLNSEIEGKITDVLEVDTTLVRRDPFAVGITVNKSLKIGISTGYELKSHLTLAEIITPGLLVKKKTGSKYLFFYKVFDGDTTAFIFITHDSKGFPISSEN